jgi:hypothetical protein
LIFNKEFLKISWKILGYIGKTTYLYSVIKMIDMYNENTFKNFSASKMSYNPKFSVSVEYTDWMGKTHRIECKTRKALNEARAFLSMFKSESAKISSILNEYPVKLGKFPKKYHSEIKSDLTAAGLGMASKYLLK